MQGFFNGFPERPRIITFAGARFAIHMIVIDRNMGNLQVFIQQACFQMGCANVDTKIIHIMYLPTSF